MSQALCYMIGSQRQDMVSVHFTHSSFMSLTAEEKPEIKAKADQQKNTEPVRGSMQIYANEQKKDREVYRNK